MLNRSEDVEDGDEEVFFGPVGHTEKCVATILGEVPSEEPPVAPLTAAQIVELFTEAQKVAYHISAQNGDKRKDDQKLGAGIPIVISPLASPLPAEEKKHCRKGTFTLDSPFQDEAAPEPEPVPEPAPEFTRGASGRRSLPQVGDCEDENCYLQRSVSFYRGCQKPIDLRFPMLLIA